MSIEAVKQKDDLHGHTVGDISHLRRNTIYDFGNPATGPEEYLVMGADKREGTLLARVTTVASTTDGAESLKVVDAALSYGQRLPDNKTLVYTKKVNQGDGTVMERVIGLPQPRDYSRVRRKMPMRGAR